MIDHIMVMLYPRYVMSTTDSFRNSVSFTNRHVIAFVATPRADHRASGIAGPAAVTNGGTAMLVMRNFGYLGLHSVVHSRSSLARDRLVDFTGEVQVRRRETEEVKEEEEELQRSESNTKVNKPV